MLQCLNYRWFAALLLCWAFPAIGIAQTRLPDVDTMTFGDWDKSGYFAPTLTYLSDNVYLGRKDTAALPYIGPALSFHSASGVGLTAAAAFSTRGGSTQLDMWALEGGYDHSFGEHWAAGAYAGSLHYQKSSTNVRADANAYAGGYLGFDNDYVSPQVEATAIFGSKTDFVTAFELEHEFTFVDDRLSITPKLKLNAGTQHYYTSYLVQKLNKKGKTVSRSAVSGESGFSILDYELSLPLAANFRHWHFEATPTYFIPESPVSITEGATTVPEHLSNSFVLHLSVSYRFLLRKKR